MDKSVTVSEVKFVTAYEVINNTGSIPVFALGSGVQIISLRSAHPIWIYQILLISHFNHHLSNTWHISAGLAKITFINSASQLILWLTLHPTPSQ